MRRPPFFWFVVFVCLAYLPALALLASISTRVFGVTKAAGWSVRASGTGWFVSEVNPEGPATGRIQRGDRLLAINGDPRSAILGTQYWAAVERGATYTVDLERAGQRLALELPMPLATTLTIEALSPLQALAFFAVGAALGLLRPRESIVRLISVLMMLCGFGFLPWYWGRGFFTAGEQPIYSIVTSMVPWIYPLTYHLFSRFPTGQSPGPAWRIVQWVLYGLTLLVFWPMWSLTYAGANTNNAVAQFLLDHPALYLNAAALNARVGWAYSLLCLALAIVVTTHNYRRLADADARRRIRWVVAGFSIAVTPFIVVQFCYRVLGLISDAGNRSYAGVLPVQLMILIPISIAIAIWKEQLFDIAVIVRRGLQYLLARTALRVFLALPVALLVMSIVSNRDLTVAQILTQGSGWINVVWIGAAAIALQSRQRLQTTLDRRFFREAYEQEQVLTQLIEEVRQRDSLAEIAAHVSARIEAVLHPKTVHVLYRAVERSNRFEGHSSSASMISHELSQQTALLQMLDATPSIRYVPADTEAQLPAAEQQWLERLGVRLIVPVTGSADRLVGLLLLGERLSDEPYSPTDQRLLLSIAAQIGLVYENQHLKDRVRRDADVRRDVLARLDDQNISLLKECPACGRCYDSAVQRCEIDGTELTLTLPIERTLEGKYRLERALGRGGFGAVYEATDLRLQRQVAAKVMVGSLFGDRDAIRRFEREARAAARIDHRHITRVHDYGTIGSGGAYLIMELVAGRTWRKMLQSETITPLRASEWFRQLLDGVQFAHKLGIVHRDLKPENVMIVHAAGADDLKVMDFGLAKVTSGEAAATETQTAAGVTMGTLGYMAPEMLTGGAVDERADLFAIGVMLVETLTGARPFRGQSQHELLTAVLSGEYHLPAVSAEMRALDGVVQQCLAKDPRDRYGSAAELSNDLVPLLARFPSNHAAANADAGAPTADLK